MSVENGTELTEIADDVRALITRICPLAAGRTMYGGTVYETRAGVASTLVCGVFIYKSHVSLEFSDGAFLQDPGNLLEGKGKKRRHIKMRALKDIDDKNVAGFLMAAFAGAEF